MSKIILYDMHVSLLSTTSLQSKQLTFGFTAVLKPSSLASHVRYSHHFQLQSFQL